MRNAPNAEVRAGYERIMQDAADHPLPASGGTDWRPLTRYEYNLGNVPGATLGVSPTPKREALIKERLSPTADWPKPLDVVQLQADLRGNPSGVRGSQGPLQAADTRSSAGYLSGQQRAIRNDLNAMGGLPGSNRRMGRAKTPVGGGGVIRDDMHSLSIVGASTLYTNDFQTWATRLAREGTPIPPGTDMLSLYAASRQQLEHFIMNDTVVKGEIAKLEEQLRQFETGRWGAEWYDQFTNAAFDIFGNQDAPAMIRIFGVTSHNASLDSNTAAAVKAYAQLKAGMPLERIHVGMEDGPQCPGRAAAAVPLMR